MHGTKNSYRISTIGDLWPHLQRSHALIPRAGADSESEGSDSGDSGKVYFVVGPVRFRYHCYLAASDYDEDASDSQAGNWDEDQQGRQADGPGAAILPVPMDHTQAGNIRVILWWFIISSSLCLPNQASIFPLTSTMCSTMGAHGVACLLVHPSGQYRHRLITEVCRRKLRAYSAVSNVPKLFSQVVPSTS